MVGLESALLLAKRRLTNEMHREPTLAELAQACSVPEEMAERAWHLLTLPPARLKRHLEAGKAQLTEKEYLVLSLRLDPEHGGVRSAEQVARAADLPEATVLRLEDRALAKLRQVHSPDLP